MDLNDRQTFEWHPADPQHAFHFVIVCDRPDMGEREYAIAVTPVGADGEPLQPDQGPWVYSQILGTYYQYVPKVENVGAARLRPWRSATPFSHLTIEAIHWDASADVRTYISAIAISSTVSAPERVRSWDILNPINIGDDK